MRRLMMAMALAGLFAALASARPKDQASVYKSAEAKHFSTA